MSFDVVEITLASSVADAATFTVAYPTNRNSGDYQGGRDNQVVSATYGKLTELAGGVSFAFGAANITVTNNSGGTLASGTKLWVQIDRIGLDDGERASLADTDTMTMLSAVMINLGAPDTADPNGFVVSQNLTAAGVFSISATAAAALAAAALAGSADVPRNVVAAWTGAAVITITGTDVDGNTIVESSASGTALAGKKSFKTVTNIAVSANVTGLTVGTGDVLGIPAFLAQAGLVIAELEDGVDATAGTLVSGVTATATAITGDTRGTYDPNSACNGAKAFQLVALMGDPGYSGVAQFAG